MQYTLLKFDAFEKGVLTEYKNQVKYVFLLSSDLLVTFLEHRIFFLFKKKKQKPQQLVVAVYVTCVKPEGFYWRTVNHIDVNRTIDKVLTEKSVSQNVHLGRRI